MRKIIWLYVLLLGQLGANAQLAKKIELTADNRLLGLGKQYFLQSEILEEERPFIVSLPQGYDNNEADYPVIYVLDGLENIKHIVGTVEMLTESGLIPPMIVVGIQSLDRARDLTPSNAGQNVYGGTGNAGISQSGGARQFLQFISEELFPYIEERFRTHSFRILEGHSFGGLFCVYALMEHPELFDSYIVAAPALWWNNEEMAQNAISFFSKKEELNKTVFFGVGGGEGWGMKQELIRYVDVIKEHQPDGLRWVYKEVGDEDHMASRLLLNYHGLKFLFSDLKISDNLKSNFTVELFLQSEEELRLKYGANAKRPSGEYMNLVFEEIERKNENGAIAILKRATEAYPNYLGLWTFLAQRYEKLGQIELAIDTYKQGIEISRKYKLGQEEDFAEQIERLNH